MTALVYMFLGQINISVFENDSFTHSTCDDLRCLISGTTAFSSVIFVGIDSLSIACTLQEMAV